MPSDGEQTHPIFRPGGVSYLAIPTDDVRRSAAFYEAVFGWTLSGEPDWPSFADATGHVIGHWVKELGVVGEAGIVPYVYVESVEETLERILEQGGATVRAPFPEGDLLVAAFRDPAGNVLGLWQRVGGAAI